MHFKLSHLAAAAMLAGGCQAAVLPSGYASIKYIFNFGASFESTDMPWSNFSTSEGPMWTDYLAYTYNKGPVYRVNFAYPGASSDADIAPNSWAFDFLAAFTGTTIQSMQMQVLNFTTNYAQNTGPLPWTSANTLFTWPGSTTANDIQNLYGNGEGGLPQIEPLVESLGLSFDEVCLLASSHI
jgi:hypothetical protein